MKSGELYEGYFRFQNSQYGKYRPFLVLQSDHVKSLALICKITTSYPTTKFPHRVPILHWQLASLAKFSHAQVDNHRMVSFSIRRKFIGTLVNDDFITILNYFRWLNY